MLGEDIRRASSERGMKVKFQIRSEKGTLGVRVWRVN
jgi:hypothetical protein